MGLQGPPYAVLSPLVTDPLAPPGDPESSLFLTCRFVSCVRFYCIYTLCTTVCMDACMYLKELVYYYTDLVLTLPTTEI